jgi:7-cyano-7-deazaguanine synthase
MNKQKALVLLSGGLDSATCLYWAKERFSIVYAITFNYKNRGKREKNAALQIANEANITNLIELDVPFMRESIHTYSDTLTKNSDSRSSAYIPARNLMFYSIALYYAENLRISSIIGGHNRHDGHFFRDATQSYLQKLTRLFREGSKMKGRRSTDIVLPLCNMYRKKIITLAVKLGVPIELTWSCHKNGNTHCRSCYACIERLQSFRSLGMNDPVFSA